MISSQTKGVIKFCLNIDKKVAVGTIKFAILGAKFQNKEKYNSAILTDEIKDIKPWGGVRQIGSSMRSLESVHFMRR